MDQEYGQLSAEERSRGAAEVGILWQATEVWASPLTRAIQTTLLALQGHPALREKGLMLTSDAREIKGRGGFDTVGCAKGPAIQERVRQELLELLVRGRGGGGGGRPAGDDGSASGGGACNGAGARASEARGGDDDEEQREAVAQLMATKMDFNDAVDCWWTAALQADKDDDVDERINELLNDIRFSQARSIILVSHSNLFRALLKRRASPTLKDGPKGGLARQCGKVKLDNCSMVRLELDFTEALSECIVDVDLILGARFEASASSSFTASARSSASSPSAASSSPSSSPLKFNGPSRKVLDALQSTGVDGEDLSGSGDDSDGDARAVNVAKSGAARHWGPQQAAPPSSATVPSGSGISRRPLSAARVGGGSGLAGRLQLKWRLPSVKRLPVQRIPQGDYYGPVQLVASSIDGGTPALTSQPVRCDAQSSDEVTPSPSIAGVTRSRSYI